MAKKNEAAENAANNQAGSVAVIAEPEVGSVIEPIVPIDAQVPSAEVQRTETEALVEPAAIVPGIIFEKTEAALQGAGEAPTMLITKSGRAKRVEVICEGMLGHKGLRKGAITDDEEYVALLGTDRGQKLVREVK